jgi:internalin A
MDANNIAEGSIESAFKRNAATLDLRGFLLTELPASLAKLKNLQFLDISNNKLSELPQFIGELKGLRGIDLSANQITFLPDAVRQLGSLEQLVIRSCDLTTIPEWIGDLKELRRLDLSSNRLTEIPEELIHLPELIELILDHNPLHQELAAAYKQGLRAFKSYVKATFTQRIFLNEAKLIFIGEGEVGKSCLLDALAGKDWQHHETTHGIQIESIKATTTATEKEITLNCWDFGGQRVYRPTHQLFFSSPAVYLVVWKPREGIQQGFVKEWIKLIIHREPTAKIIIVATHGGPQQRQPDIDRQEIIDMFGQDTVLDFFFVDSKPQSDGQRRGISELKQRIADIAETLPEVGRSVPENWQEVRSALQREGKAYISLDEVLKICKEHMMDDHEANLFVRISHRLGHLIHYEHDPTLRDIVVLKPDWLTTAISFVLDDETTRIANGLIPLSRLSQLWNDPEKDPKFRYPQELHPIFIRLMERFDLSYRVDSQQSEKNEQACLIAQLVPDYRPELRIQKEWPDILPQEVYQQEQICRITNIRDGQSASAEGLFYQLIVRLHRYSLGREEFNKSIHWQRGMILDADYNGRAFLEHTGNDVRIITRGPFPERLLTMLTEEIKFLVESFWEGLKCNVMVPCIFPCGRDREGTGLYEVEKIIQSKSEERYEYPCPLCNQWQPIDKLLRNAPGHYLTVSDKFSIDTVTQGLLKDILTQIEDQSDIMIGRFENLDQQGKRTLSLLDDRYTTLLALLADEAREGPRLFSLVPVSRSFLNFKRIINNKYRITFWCEHSKLPVPLINGHENEGIYEVEIPQAWIKASKPFLNVLHRTLSLLLPVAASGIKLALDDKSYKIIEEQLNLGIDITDSSLKIPEKFKEETNRLIEEKLNLDIDITKIVPKVPEKFGAKTKTKPQMKIVQPGFEVLASGYKLRELHSFLKSVDPDFKRLGLVRVMNKRKEFLWVHPAYEGEY